MIFLVRYVCPECGFSWYEDHNPNGTRTNPWSGLCARCQTPGVRQ